MRLIRDMSGYRTRTYGILAVALIAAVILVGQYYLSSDSYVFDWIYQTGYWGRAPSGEGSSGPGSTEQASRQYRKFLEALIKQESIQSVVDAGCGDWEFSQHIDWAGAEYLGLDVSTVVLDRVTARYSSSNVRFQRGSVVDVLPVADLLIVKDVLQHLPIEDISQFIQNNLQPGRYKIAVLTNDRARNDEDNNSDILRGGYRTIDLAKPPFNLKGLEDYELFEWEPTREKVVQVLRFE